MFLVFDNASNNVLAEYDAYTEAEQRRIQIVGMNPMLSEAIVVVDLDHQLAEYETATTRAAQTA